MSGTKIGGVRAGNTNKTRYGDDYYKNIGKLGGQASRGGGFQKGSILAQEAGRRGGLKSRRSKPMTQEQKEAQWEQQQAKVDPLQ